MRKKFLPTCTWLFKKNKIARLDISFTSLLVNTETRLLYTEHCKEH